MRKIFAILAFITGILTFASCEDERQIKDTKLPSDARSFISLYFPDLEIIYAEKDFDDRGRSYSVKLSDGTEIEFFESGEWESVDCKFSSVPDEIVPVAILDDIRQRLPQYRITKIEKETGGYELEVSGKTYIYDKNGVFVSESYSD